MSKICWKCLKTFDDEQMRCTECNQRLQEIYNEEYENIGRQLKTKGYNFESFYINKSAATINFMSGINVPVVPNEFYKETVGNVFKYIRIVLEKKNSEDEAIEILSNWAEELPDFYEGTKTTQGEEIKYYLDINKQSGKLPGIWGMSDSNLDNLINRAKIKILSGTTLHDAYALYIEDQPEMDKRIEEIKDLQREYLAAFSSKIIECIN